MKCKTCKASLALFGTYCWTCRDAALRQITLPPKSLLSGRFQPHDDRQFKSAMSRTSGRADSHTQS